MRARYTCTLVPVVLATLLSSRHALAQPVPVSEEPTVGDAPVVETEKAEDATQPEEVQDPTRPPPRGQGAGWGLIKSRKDSETLLEALVTAIGGKE